MTSKLKVVWNSHLILTIFFPQVCTEGRLILVFTFDDLMRIKTWHFTITHYSELIPRSVLAVNVSYFSHELKKSKLYLILDHIQARYPTSLVKTESV